MPVLYTVDNQLGDVDSKQADFYTKTLVYKS